VIEEHLLTIHELVECRLTRRRRWRRRLASGWTAALVIALGAPGAAFGNLDLPPEMPTGVTGAPGDMQVSLDWRDNVEEDLAGYRVFHRVSGQSSYDSPVAVSQSAYTLGGLTNGVTHIFSLIAVDAAGQPSPATEEVRVTPMSSGAYWGARIDSESYGSGADAPWGASTWDLFESHAGKRVSMLHFGQPMPWQQSFSTVPFDLTVARGAIPLVSYSTDDLTSLENGSYDASITRWANAAKSWGKPFLLRFNWEMNGTWFGYGAQAKADPELYVNAWRHFHDVVQEAGANNVTWTFCPNVKFSGSTPIASLYPGDAYVDWLCMDGYNFGTNPLKPAGWAGFYSVFKATYDELLGLAPSKPIVIAETASTGLGGEKAHWIMDALSTQLPFVFPQVRAVVWFNWNIAENGGRWDWAIESSTSGQSAFARAIASSYYETNQYGVLPSGTKVPAP
jgi:hypothetical protein